MEVLKADTRLAGRKCRRIVTHIVLSNILPLGWKPAKLKMDQPNG